MVSDALPPVSAYTHEPKKKVLSPEEVEKSLERLYTRSHNVTKQRHEEYVKAVDEQLVHNKLLHVPSGEPTDVEKARIEKLYTQPLEKKKKAMESTRKTTSDHEPKIKHVTPDEQETIVDRLYSQAITSHQQNLTNSVKRVYGDGQSPRKGLDKDGVLASVDNLYTKAIEKKKAADASLEDKYGWKKITSEKKITPELAKALAERLQSKTH